MAVAEDDRLFGTTNSGTLWTRSADGQFDVLKRLSASEGQFPATGLTLGPDGAYYGTASDGGLNGAGSIFRITRDGTFSVICSFTGDADGANPTSRLAKNQNGVLYGTTSLGGLGLGTVYSVDVSGNLISLHRFSGQADGAAPNDVIVGQDGNIYGTTQNGGSGAGSFGGNGTIFRLTPAGTLLTLDPKNRSWLPISAALGRVSGGISAG